MGGSSPDFASLFMPHFRRLKHKPVREKAAKNVFAGVFTQIESILFSSENRYRDSIPHYLRVVFSLYANRNKTPKICCAFLFSFGLTFLRVASQFSPGFPFAVASIRFLALPRRKRKMGGASPDFASRFML